MSASTKHHQPMNINERMIWAAVFAKERDLHNPPRHVLGGTGNKDAEWREWERGRIHQAIEIAGGAVKQLRREVESIKDGFGDDSSIYLFLCDMVGAKTKEYDGGPCPICHGSGKEPAFTGCEHQCHRGY